MSFRLPQKILLIATVAILCTVAAVVATSAKLSARAYESALQSRSTAIAKSLSLQLQRLLALGIDPENLVGFEDQCREIVEAYPGTDHALVAAPDGRVLFHSTPGGAAVLAPALATAVQQAQERFVTHEGRGVTWHSIVMPVDAAQVGHVASVIVSFRAEQVSSQVKQMLWTSILTGLLVLLTGVLVLHVALAAFVTRPLARLMATVVTLRESPLDLTRRAPVASDDEVGRLGQAFNDLLERLHKSTVSRGALEQAMTELRTLSDALYAQKERAEVTLRSIAEGVVTTDAQGSVGYLNPVAEMLTGWTAAEASGRALHEVVRLLDTRTQAMVADPLDMAPQASELELLRRDGSALSIRHSVAQMHDRAGQAAGHVLTLRDVSEERRVAHRRTWEASHDVLTGLPNRREFEHQVQAALEEARGRGRQYAVCFMDLDRFKIVNDNGGHAAGDELLRQVAGLLAERIRLTDTLARMGGDEFALLLPGCTVECARVIANDLLSAVDQLRFEYKGKVFTVGLSIGLAALTAESVDASEVLGMADAACYWAKEQGRQRACVYRVGDQELAMRQREKGWVTRITAALDDNRFVLHHQTYLALTPSGQERTHLEVLLRMIDEEGRLVAPGSFLPAAERYHLMPAIDRWVIQAVFAGYRALAQRFAKPLTCAINLSGNSLNADGLLEFIQEQALLHALPPDAICFEITETAAINNLRHAREFMAQCRELGMRFALDDFGTGTSSFGYLRSLPVDYLKIDGSFVRNLNADSINRAMTETIHRIGRIMGLRTVAEFVENDEIIATLRDIGVDFAQGYGVSKPTPLFPESAPASAPVSPSETAQA
ncbi:EAL domain-containing protein [Azohydromonas australica]|uniref:EAL domain-containing protein n=1 Tax=Azohydromonas australica TaxID=364039 RepID=UPI00041EFA3F|nr:EAL domain-containing protein [Azohydromonas australica]